MPACKEGCSFEGWATKNDLLCDDGVIIKSGAFNVQDGEVIPLFWNHQHDSITNTLGHAVLENRKEGVYAYCFLNETPEGLHAKEAIKNGDITSMSIFATDVQQNGNQVVHGKLREVSLVLAGANPGARITSALAHGIPLDESDVEAILYTGESLILEHAAIKESEPKKEEGSSDNPKKEESVQEILDTYNEKQKKALSAIVGEIIDYMEGSEDDDEEIKQSSIDEEIHAILKHAADETDEEGESIADVIATYNEKQKKAAAVVIGEVIKQMADEEEDSEDLEHSAKGTSWEKKDHKYVKKVDGKYFYGKNDGGGSGLPKGDAGSYLSLSQSARKELVARLAAQNSDIPKDGTIRSLYETRAGRKELMAVVEGRDGQQYKVPVKEDSIKDIPGYQRGSQNEDLEERRRKKEMAHSAFDNDSEYVASGDISQDTKKTIMQRAKALNSFKAAVEEAVETGILSQAATPTTGMTTPTGTANYGVNDLSMFMDDGYHSLTDRPEFISRNMTWVTKWMNKVRKTPFKRIKSLFADITAEEARARGYVKGNKKVEEVITTLKRTTDPQIVYKKQKLDRQDILDIDWDIIPWLKGEMEIMLAEEEARACLIGDGRSSADQDKIQELHVRPIAKDVPLFNTVVKVTVTADMDVAARTEAIIDAIILAHKDYKGTGDPTFWTTQLLISQMLMLKDKIGHRIYKTRPELATALLVDECVPVEPMADQKIEVEGVEYPLLGIIVNPVDYTIGGSTERDKMVTEGFDIDYNQYKYLMEDYMSGALIKPFSALTFVLDDGTAVASSRSRAKAAE